MANDYNDLMPNKKRLGRGLASLLETDGDFILGQNVSHARENNLGSLLDISIDDVGINLDQPRKYFDEAKLSELSESIKNNGLLQPIIVSLNVNNENKHKYVIVAGERRYRACKLAGFTKIKAIVLNLNKQKILKNAIIENIQREDLNPIEEANGYKKIIDYFGYTHEQLAKEIGKSRAYITNLLRILTLPLDIQNAIKDKKITIGHAKVLLGLKEPNKYFKKIIDEHLSVRQLENIAQKQYASKEEEDYSIPDSAFNIVKHFHETNDNSKKNKNYYNSDFVNDKQEWQNIKDNIKLIEKQLSENCGFNVCLKLQSNGSGKFEIFFKNSNDILEIIKLFK